MISKRIFQVFVLLLIMAIFAYELAAQIWLEKPVTGLTPVPINSRVYYPNMREAHPVLGYVHKPNSEFHLTSGEWDTVVKTNRFGFRDIDRPFEKTAGTTRILVLGDSYTAAIRNTTEDVFTSILERALNTSGDNVEVLNMAVGGWATTEQVTAFETLGYKFSPDVVVLMVYLQNDMLENYLRHNRESAAKQEAVRDTPDWLAHLVESLSNSATYRLLRDQARKSDLMYSLVEGLGIPSRRERPLGFFDFLQAREDADVAEAYRVTFELIDRLRLGSQQLGAEMMVALAPSPFQYRPELIEAEVANKSSYYATIPGRYPIEDIDTVSALQPNRRFEQFCVQNKNCVDLHTELSKQSQDPVRDFYFESVDHWNRSGEAAVARVLESVLRPLVENTRNGGY